MDLLLRPDLRAAGYTDAEVRQALRRGGLRPVRRGAYGRGPAPDGVAARHLELVAADGRFLGEVDFWWAAARLGGPCGRLGSTMRTVRRRRADPRVSRTRGSRAGCA